MIKHPQNKGAALLIFILLFLVGSSGLMIMLQQAITTDLSAARELGAVKQAFFTSESGLEDVVYRLQEGMGPSTETLLRLHDVTATTSYNYNGTESRFEITSSAAARGQYRSHESWLYVGSGASFNFGVQSGNGGFVMANNSSVQGNVFSNGAITGQGSATIYGDVISAGPAGSIDGVTATGSARARLVQNSDVGADVYAYTLDGGAVAGDAYVYERIGGAVVYGNTYGHQPEEATTTLPISDEQIDDMKQDIIDNGTIIAATDPECAGGTYVIDSNVTLSQMKIECDVTIEKNSTTLTLTNGLWIEGNLTTSNATIAVDSAVGNQTVPIIVDNVADRITSSQINVGQGTDFIGSGSPKSYILLISQNDAAEMGSSETAINVAQSSSGDLLVYSGSGKVGLNNNISLKEVTGYLIDMGNQTEIIYESGLVNLLFTSGPGGGFTLANWRELK